MITKSGRWISFRAFSLLNSSPVQSSVKAKRAKENDPNLHTSEHIGLFYTVPDPVRKEVFGHGGLPKSFVENLNTFGETCFMIRKPAVEVIDFLKKTDFSRPAIRYVLYGKQGCGKSISLCHILHYAHKNKFYILHVPWVWDWFRNDRHEVVYSTSHQGLVDLPVIGAQWLKHFQTQNAQLLEQDGRELLTQKDYVWNQRESTPAGSPLKALVTYGINRIKYSCDCIDAVVQEIKLAARENRCKAVVVVDGFNALVREVTNLKTEDRTKVTPDKVSLVQTFLDASKNDWINGAVILTVDEMSARFQSLNSHLPLYLLGKKGFEHIDPFIGIHVNEFSDLELNSMLDYYEDRKWLQKTGGRHELSFVSHNNPYELMRLCASL